MMSSNENIFGVTGSLCKEFTGSGATQRPVTRSFDVFFDLRLNKRLSKHSWGWWFETLSWSLWRHHNETATSSHSVDKKSEKCSSNFPWYTMVSSVLVFFFKDPMGSDYSTWMKKFRELTRHWWKNENITNICNSFITWSTSHRLCKWFLFG